MLLNCGSSSQPGGREKFAESCGGVVGSGEASEPEDDEDGGLLEEPEFEGGGVEGVRSD